METSAGEVTPSFEIQGSHCCGGSLGGIWLFWRSKPSKQPQKNTGRYRLRDPNRPASHPSPQGLGKNSLALGYLLALAQKLVTFDCRRYSHIASTFRAGAQHPSKASDAHRPRLGQLVG